MPQANLVVYTPAGLVEQHVLPYQDQAFIIAREDRIVRVQALRPSVMLSVEAHASGVMLRSSGLRYELALMGDDILHVRTGPGNDRVHVATAVANQVVVETGDGDDIVQVEGLATADSTAVGRVVVDAGPGNDLIETTRLQQVEIDAGTGNDTVHSGAAHAFIYAGEGEDIVKVVEGRAVIEALDGHNRLTTGMLDDRLYGDARAITPEGGFTAPVLYDLAQTTLPADYLKTFLVQGEAHYIEKVNRQLNLLRASPTASVLLHDLVTNGARVVISSIEALDNAYADYDPGQGDPTIRNGKRGARALNCRIGYNPLAQRPDTPSLVMLYHELCHVWNFVTGSVMDEPERQAVGLEAGPQGFDYDDDPATPPDTSNPFPFNENALRLELGLPARQTYP